MNKREKILAGIIAGVLGVFVLGFGVRGFFVKPLVKIDKETALLRERLGKINDERREYFDAEDKLRKIAQRAFASDLNQASARSGEMITAQIAAAGLNEADFTRLPVGPRRLKGASELGWSIQGKGNLNQVINLLFLLENSLQVHRIEGVTLTSYDTPGEVKVRFLYLTLVLDPAPEFDRIELIPRVTLEGPERFAYNSILERDILRPYVKAPPPPKPPKSDSPKAPEGPESLRIVSLSEWNGQPEVHILDSSHKKTLSFRPGDKLKDNTEIVAIDYRPLPSSRSPLLISHSRVILKTHEGYWAVERGQTLAEKRKLEPAEWPRQ